MTVVAIATVLLGCNEQATPPTAPTRPSTTDPVAATTSPAGPPAKARVVRTGPYRFVGSPIVERWPTPALGSPGHGYSLYVRLNRAVPRTRVVFSIDGSTPQTNDHDIVRPPRPTRCHDVGFDVYGSYSERMNRGKPGTRVRVEARIYGDEEGHLITTAPIRAAPPAGSRRATPRQVLGCDG